MLAVTPYPSDYLPNHYYYTKPAHLALKIRARYVLRYGLTEDSYLSSSLNLSSKARMYAYR